MTKRVVSLTADLLFASNIEATLGRADYEVVTVETLSELQATVASQQPDVVTLDLHAGVEASDVVAATTAPVVAFGRHTEPGLLRSAREAGCVASVPRSSFVEEMTSLVEAAGGTRPSP